ncbi:MAG: retropepsin-like aspartic protease [Flavobacteriaceae bacterium]
MKKIISIALIYLISLSTYGQDLIDKVPIKLIDGLIFIELKINDIKEPLNFMFDTGAGITVIDTKIAKEIQLSISGELKIGTSGKTLSSKLSNNNQIILGNKLKLDSIPLALMDLSHLSDYFKTNVDGIIGFDLLNKVVTETNIDALEMRFFSNTNYIFNGKSKPIKLIGLESNHLGLEINIVPKGKKENITLIIKIDTGAGNYLTFHNNSVTKHKLINPKKRYKIKKGFGADSTITKNLNGKVSLAIFGNKKWKNIPVVFEVDPLNETSERQADGLIGQKMLLDFNITYNLKNGIVYLENRN